MAKRVTIIGLDALQEKLKDNKSLKDVKRVVRQNGVRLNTEMKQKAEFKGHYGYEKGKGKVFKKPTGTTKRSITLSYEDSGFTSIVQPTTEYAPYLEYGTRFMEAQPFVKPALDVVEKQFKKDMKKLVE